MELNGAGVRLTVYIGESDRWEHRPLHEAIMLKARGAGLAGCTVLRGHAGFGAKSRIHKFELLSLSFDLPIVVEIIDTAEKVRAFLPVVEEMMQDGLVTIEPLEVHIYRHTRNKQA
jgi:PII-like signaling protein